MHSSDPIRGRDENWDLPLGRNSEQSSDSGASIDFSLPLDQHLVGAIARSTSIRNEKKIALSEAHSEALGNLEQLLTETEELYKKHLIISNNYFMSRESTSSDEFGGSDFWSKRKKKEQKAASVNLDYQRDYSESLCELNQKSEFLKLYGVATPIVVIDAHCPESLLHEKWDRFLFLKERILNNFVNEHSFPENIKIFFTSNLCSIYPQINENSDSWELNIEVIEKRSETHNGGKKPVFVTLLVDENVKAKWVCKPRPAHVDSIVINLFGKLNKLVGNYGVMLPTYEILNIDNFSIWEKIEGTTLTALGCTKTESPHDFIQALGELGEKRSLLVEKIKKMAHVCSILEISDLHGDNMILKGVKKTSKGIEIEGEIDIVPIDLEVVMQNYITLLMGTKDKYETGFTRIQKLESEYHLTEKEVSLIEIAKSELNQCVLRVLPLGSADFNQAIADHTGAEKLTEIVINSFCDQGYKIQNTEELKILITNNMLNCDAAVPVKKNSPRKLGDFSEIFSQTLNF